MNRSSFTDRVEAYLKARPNMWIAAIEFESIGGRQAWRTRLSDCRRKRGMVIEYEPHVVTAADGSTIEISGYVYYPPVPVTPPSLFDGLQEEGRS